MTELPPELAVQYVYAVAPVLPEPVMVAGLPAHIAAGVEQVGVGGAVQEGVPFKTISSTVKGGLEPPESSLTHLKPKRKDDLLSNAFAIVGAKFVTAVVTVFNWYLALVHNVQVEPLFVE